MGRNDVSHGPIISQIPDIIGMNATPLQAARLPDEPYYPPVYTDAA